MFLQPPVINILFSDICNMCEAKFHTYAKYKVKL
jgi:hypothetical protein